MNECTFKPKIIHKKKMSGFSYNERNQNWINQKERKSALRQQKIEEKETKEVLFLKIKCILFKCTFSPASGNPSAKKKSESKKGNQTALYERNKLWQEKIKEKQNRLKDSISNTN